MLDRSSIMVSMNKLSAEKRAQVVGCLVEGMSIRATVRATGVAKNTITKLLVDLGDACSYAANALLVDIAMDTLRDKVEDYAEFRRYSFAEAQRSGVAVDALDLDRARWQHERENELKLEKLLRRVRSSEYTSTAAERIFRVC